MYAWLVAGSSGWFHTRLHQFGPSYLLAHCISSLRYFHQHLHHGPQQVDLHSQPRWPQTAAPSSPRKRGWNSVSPTVSNMSWPLPITLRPTAWLRGCIAFEGGAGGSPLLFLWPSELPWILLSLRSVSWEASCMSSAELVYRTPAMHPGQFPVQAASPAESVLQQSLKSVFYHDGNNNNGCKKKVLLEDHHCMCDKDKRN